MKYSECVNDRKVAQMKKKSKVGERHILNEYVPLNVQEAYRGIRTNIECALNKEGCKKIMVSGPEIGVGSTITCINLAISFAQAGMEVLVIDCDLRNSEVNALLQGTTLLGLTELLQEGIDINTIIQKSHYEHLDFIGAGGKVANPTELLGSENLKKLMVQLEKRYQYIFVNVAPINLVSDGRILAAQMDGVIVVIKQDKTTHKELEKMLCYLYKVNAPILGTIFNSCRVSRKEKRKYKLYNRVSKFRL